MVLEPSHPVVIEAGEHRHRWRNMLSRRIPGFDSFRHILETFLSRGLDGAVLSIKDRKTGTSAEFRKHILSKGKFGIKVRLKLSDKIEPKIRELEMFCAKIGITCQLIDLAGADEKYLTADFGQDLDKAHAVLVYFLADLHGLTSDTRFTVKWENVSPWNEVIDSPGQMPLSDGEGITLTREQYRQATGVSMRSANLMGLAALAQIFGVGGMIISMIWQSDPPITLISLGAVNFNAPIIGLMFMVLTLIGYLAILTDMYWLSSKKSDSRHAVLIPRTTKGAFLVFWSRPINWISVGVMIVAMIRWISI